MADRITRVEYYSAIIPHKPGEAARILAALEQAGINLVAFSGFPEGRKAQMDFIAADGAALAKAMKTAGLEVSRKKTAFLVQGEDHAGAAASPRAGRRNQHHLVADNLRRREPVRRPALGEAGGCPEGREDSGSRIDAAISVRRS